MAAFLLHEVETLVARAFEAGEVCDLGAWPGPVVRGEALGRILLGLPVCLDGVAEAKSIRPHWNGARLRRATVTGPLILDDVVAADGGAFPPLDFQECVFPEIVSLCRARLRHLSLAGSSLSHLRGVSITVAGPVDLSRISSAETGATTGAAGRGLCWVELREAEIEGGLIAAGARLVAPVKRPGTFVGRRRPEYALDLRAATIGNELALSPDFEACGGVNIRSARIDKDVMAQGSVLSGVEGDISSTTSKGHVWSGRETASLAPAVDRRTCHAPRNAAPPTCALSAESLPTEAPLAFRLPVILRPARKTLPDTENRKFSSGPIHALR